MFMGDKYPGVRMSADFPTVISQFSFFISVRLRLHFTNPTNRSWSMVHTRPTKERAHSFQRNPPTAVADGSYAAYKEQATLTFNRYPQLVGFQKGSTRLFFVG